MNEMILLLLLSLCFIFFLLGMLFWDLFRIKRDIAHIGITLASHKSAIDKMDKQVRDVYAIAFCAYPEEVIGEKDAV